MGSRNIPIEADLGVYARLLLNWQRTRDQKDFALTVLALRVVIEKGRNTFKKRGEIRKIQELIDSINQDTHTAAAYAAQVKHKPILLARYPMYSKAGLV